MSQELASRQRCPGVDGSGRQSTPVVETWWRRRGDGPRLRPLGWGVPPLHETIAIFSRAPEFGFDAVIVPGP